MEEEGVKNTLACILEVNSSRCKCKILGTQVMGYSSTIFTLKVDDVFVQGQWALEGHRYKSGI